VVAGEPSATERVLVVEDDELVAEIALAALATLNVDAVHVADGRRALVRLTTDKWDLVVTDIELPGATGLQILEAAKDAAPGTPVILMTAHQQLDYAIAAVRGRADEFLVKPIDPEKLASTAKALLGAARTRRAAQNADRRTVLAIGAHPDDIEIGCAGALLEHREQGDDVVLLVITGGEQGGDASLRAQEAMSAARLLGAELVHHELPDTSVPESGETIEIISGVIEQHRPDVVYTHSLNDNHQDHRNVHRATIVAAREVPNVFAYQSPSSAIAFSPGRFVDITPFMDAKLRALREFRTQHQIRPYLEEDLVVATARYWSRFGGNGRYVEPLEVVRTSGPTVNRGGAPGARATWR
jgi:LmbE family N-acetylglucosaminyl deacetylase/ActR/RegA family two-component response regulator